MSKRTKRRANWLRNQYAAEVLKIPNEMPQAGVTVVNVAHDSWCRIWKGGPCNCRPVVTHEPSRGME